MTDLELRQLDAQVHEAMFGEPTHWAWWTQNETGPWTGWHYMRPVIGNLDDPPQPGPTIKEPCNAARVWIPRYTTDLTAAWTLDKGNWEWGCQEHHTVKLIQLSLVVYSEDGWQEFTAEEQWIDGDKCRAYCLARVRCALQVLEAKKC